MTKTVPIGAIPSVTASDDGMTISIEFERADGIRETAAIPYSQADWLMQALLQVCQGAYQRQIESGRLAGRINSAADQTMIVQTFRSSVNPTTQQVLVEFVGGPPNQPPGKGSLLVDQQQARDLAASLNSAAEMLRQTSRPS